MGMKRQPGRDEAVVVKNDTRIERKAVMNEILNERLTVVEWNNISNAHWEEWNNIEGFLMRNERELMKWLEWSKRHEWNENYFISFTVADQDASQ